MLLEWTPEGNADESDCGRGGSGILVELLQALKLEWILKVILSWGNEPSVKSFINQSLDLGCAWHGGMTLNKEAFLNGGQSSKGWQQYSPKPGGTSLQSWWEYQGSIAVSKAHRLRQLNWKSSLQSCSCWKTCDFKTGNQKYIALVSGEALLPWQ